MPANSYVKPLAGINLFEKQDSLSANILCTKLDLNPPSTKF